MTDVIETPAIVPVVPKFGRAFRFARELSLVIAGQIGVAAVGLGGLRVLTTLLGPEQFGILALGLSIATLFQQVALGPVAVATLRYAGTAWETGGLMPFMRDVDRMLAQAIGLCLAGGAAAGVVLAAFGLWHWLVMGAMCLWFSAASALLATNLAIDAALRHRGWVSGMQVGSESLRFAVAAVALTTFHTASAPIAMAGFALALTVAGAVQRIRTRARVRSAERETVVGDEWRPALLRFAKPLAVTGGLTWSQMASDRWSLNAMISTSQVGVYSVVYQIAVAPFSLLGVTIQQLLAPIVFQIAGTGKNRDAVRASHLQVLAAVAVILLATGVAMLVTWQFHAAIFALLVGPQFATYSSLLPLGVLSGGLLAAGQVVATTVLSRGETEQLVLPKAVTAVLGLILNVIGAHYYGVIGVLSANAVFATIYFLWMYRMAGAARGPSARASVTGADPSLDPSGTSPEAAWSK
ncbi:MAG: hypothetical protein JWM95_931 [Gemmatimonadetes bacterium]|nr:hypothetical protein [Gemmatimonadota bacterium]